VESTDATYRNRICSLADFLDNLDLNISTSSSKNDSRVACTSRRSTLSGRVHFFYNAFQSDNRSCKGHMYPCHTCCNLFVLSAKLRTGYLQETYDSRHLSQHGGRSHCKWLCQSAARSCADMEFRRQILQRLPWEMHTIDEYHLPCRRDLSCSS
jgi:hypothetical protein